MLGWRNIIRKFACSGWFFIRVCCHRETVEYSRTLLQVRCQPRKGWCQRPPLAKIYRSKQSRKEKPQKQKLKRLRRIKGPPQESPTHDISLTHFPQSFSVHIHQKNKTYAEQGDTPARANDLPSSDYKCTNFHIKLSLLRQRSAAQGCSKLMYRKSSLH